MSAPFEVGDLVRLKFGHEAMFEGTPNTRILPGVRYRVRFVDRNDDAIHVETFDAIRESLGYADWDDFDLVPTSKAVSDALAADLGDVYPPQIVVAAREDGTIEPVLDPRRVRALRIAERVEGRKQASISLGSAKRIEAILAIARFLLNEETTP